MKKVKRSLAIPMLVFSFLIGSAAAEQIGTAFTFQGQLKQGGQPLTGLVDFEFTLWDAEIDGSDINDAVALNNVEVANGLFTVELDFETDIYSHEALWVAIAVRSPAGSGVFTELTPRQRLTPVPFALALPGLQTRQNTTSPNVIGGWDQNDVAFGVVGATVAGGGAPLIGGNPRPNVVTDYYGTVSGGSGNRAGDSDATPDDADHATIGGGYANVASASVSTVGGGWYNRATVWRATIGGGWSNLAAASAATIAGGRDNRAEGDVSTIAGGHGNLCANQYATIGGGYGNQATADYATVGGGESNTAGGVAATIPGGVNNSAMADYSFAAGRHAHADTTGSFVWADSADTPFTSTAADQFLIQAGGGVGIGTASPQDKMEVSGGMVTLDTGAGGDLTGVRIRENDDMRWTLLYRTWQDDDLEILDEVRGQSAMTFKSGTGRIGIGTNDPVGAVTLGNYEGGTGTSNVESYEKQLVLAGDFNAGPNEGESVKLLISEYDNDTSDIYPIYVEDENNGVHFYLRDQQNTKTAFFGGNVGIGTASSTQKLSVAGTIESTTGGFMFPDGSVQLTADTGGELPLPYEDSVSSSDPAFKITNTGSGHGLYGESGSGGDFAYGVYGIHTGTDNRGWIGSNLGGVFGISGTPSNAQFGYLGRIDAGVWGHADGANAWGGYFEGRGYFSGRVGIGVEPPANPLHVEGAGGLAGGYNQSEVVAHFKNTNSLYSAAAIDAESGKDSILYFSENGDAYWGIRHDVGNSHSLNIRYHGGPDKVNESIFRILADGTTRVRVLEIVGGADLAEPFAVEKSENEAERVKPGMVVVIDPDHPGQLKLAREPYDRKVAGVISGANGLRPGMVMKAEGSDMADGDHPVALTGRVWCHCDAGNGPITPGDLLTTSNTPGHAMKVTDFARAQGAILGKAMTRLEEGDGLVLVLVQPQ